MEQKKLQIYQILSKIKEKFGKDLRNLNQEELEEIIIIAVENFGEGECKIEKNDFWNYHSSTSRFESGTTLVVFPTLYDLKYQEHCFRVEFMSDFERPVD